MDPNFNFDEEVLKIISQWIKLPKLPLHCWNMNSLSRIGSGLGNPLHADDCKTKIERVSHARMLIKMNVTRPLPKSVKVEYPNGEVFEHEIIYNWKPMYCLPACKWDIATSRMKN